MTTHDPSTSSAPGVSDASVEVVAEQGQDGSFELRVKRPTTGAQRAQPSMPGFVVHPSASDESKQASQPRGGGGPGSWMPWAVAGLALATAGVVTLGMAESPTRPPRSVQSITAPLADVGESSPLAPAPDFRPYQGPARLNVADERLAPGRGMVQMQAVPMQALSEDQTQPDAGVDRGAAGAWEAPAATPPARLVQPPVVHNGIRTPAQGLPAGSLDGAVVMPLEPELVDRLREIPIEPLRAQQDEEADDEAYEDEEDENR